MNGECLLDTNTVIALLHQNPAALARVEDAGEVFVSSTVLGELYYGVERSQRAEEGLREVEEFLSGAVILACDETTARIYGRIKAELRRAGRMIPENDIWVAAAALQYDLVLIARDQHFDNVAGLRVTSW